MNRIWLSYANERRNSAAHQAACHWIPKRFTPRQHEHHDASYDHRAVNQPHTSVSRTSSRTIGKMDKRLLQGSAPINDPERDQHQPHWNGGATCVHNGHDNDRQQEHVGRLRADMTHAAAGGEVV